MDQPRFDIVAKAPENAPTGGIRRMLQQLLRHRLQLAVHHETRALPVYALVVARRDRLGRQLRRATADCAHDPTPSRVDVVPVLPPGPQDPDAPCGLVGPGLGGTRFRGVTLAAFANFLAPVVQRPVIDRTGLTGYFDIDLDFTAELGPPPPPPGEQDRFDRQAAPSIFTVVQGRLG
jgi:uncharacterized protein (TIGR03435 family)